MTARCPRQSRSATQPGPQELELRVGDHAPAYLINLYLATGEEQYADFLDSTFDTIAKHFPDYANSPFVQERFFEDWSHDQTLGLAAEPRASSGTT